MTKVFTFRVLVDYHEDIFRDIKLAADSTFEELHLCIQDAFDFDGQQIASFYLSNDNWDKGDEISMMGINDDDATLTLMSNTNLSDKVSDAHEKVLYVFDFLLMWCFYIELVEITEQESIEELPFLMRTYGASPDQYSKEVDLSEEVDSDIEDEKPEETDIFEGFTDFEQS